MTYANLAPDGEKELKKSSEENSKYDDENNDLKLVVGEFIAERYQIIDR